MMYPPITLYKDGAVMLCEDASELDTNFDPPAKPEPEVRAEIIVIAEQDPLDKFASKMEVLFDQMVEPMLNHNYSFDNPQQAIADAEKLTSDTSAIFNTMRIKLSKLAGIVCGDQVSRMATESFSAHAGLFLKNSRLIRQQGIESYPVRWKTHPAFDSFWRVSMMIDSLSCNPQVLDQMIYETELSILGGEGFDGSTFHNFNGLVDVIRCVFKDKDRLNRLSVDGGMTLSFYQMLQPMPAPADGVNSILKDQQRTLVNYLRMLSQALREVSQVSYDLQVGLVDNTVTAEVYEARMKPLIIRVVNLFAIGVIIGCSFATALRKALAIQKACEEYTKVLINTIKERNDNT